MVEPKASAVLILDETGLQHVVADPLRFKQKLRIGEEAFVLLRAKKQLYEAYETAGAAGTAAAMAGSSAVASTFFAPTGLMAALGLATAVTPVGWVVAAAVVAGGGYYGVSRWFSGKTGTFVDVIPKYINTPIDVLGAALIDLLGSLALRVAAIDGSIDPVEQDCIRDHFVRDWGFDPIYTDRALTLLAAQTADTRVKALAADLAQFQAANPDCNASAMQAELMNFLRELIAADGVIDEREELAIETIERVFHETSKTAFGKASESVAYATKAAGNLAGKAGSMIGDSARSTSGAILRKLEVTSRSLRDKRNR